MKTTIGLIFLLFSINVLAQKADIAQKDTSNTVILRDRINTSVKPLVVVDGVIYEGDIKEINAKDILRVDILKPPGAVNIYGSRAAKGVILITTKFQKKDTVKNIVDTVKNENLKIRDAATVFPRNPLLIIDNKVIDDSLSTDSLKKMNPSSILKFTVIKDAKEMALYGVRGTLGVFIVTTKQYGHHNYELKFSTILKKYKDYLKKHNDDDSNLTYVVNGTIVERKPDDKFISTLADIPKSKIKNLHFMDKYWKETFNNNNPIIVITTTQ